MTDARASTIVAQVAANVDAAARASTLVGQAAVVLDSVPARVTTVVGGCAVRAAATAPGPVSGLTLAQDITGFNVVVSFNAPTTGDVNGYEIRVNDGAWVDHDYQRPTKFACDLRTEYVVDVRAYGYGGTSTHVTATITTGSIGRVIIETAGAGTFVVPARVTSLDLILVGGGAGAGRSRNGAGGGGAGGVKHVTGLAVTALSSISYNCGAGGAGGTGSTVNEVGTNGADTTFGSEIAHGGGAGQGQPGPTFPGLSGASGGGGSGHSSDPAGAGGAGIAGEGFAGGTGKGGIIVNSRSGGGGGGAGAVGLNGTGGASPGNGGAGVDTSSWVGGPYVTSLYGHRDLGVAGWVGGGGAGGRTSSAGGATGVGGQGGGGNNNDSSDTAVGYAGRDGTGGGGGAGGANGSIGASGFGGAGGVGLIVITYDQPAPPVTPDPPEDVSILDLQPTSAVLGWSPPTDLSVPVDHYEVRLDDGTAYVVGDDLSHLFSALVSQVEYTFSVRSVAANGNASAWVSVDATTPEIPGDWEVPLSGTLRLEVEADPEPGQLVNLVQNPNGELGAFGWVTPVAGSTLTSVVIAGVGYALRYNSAAGGVSNYWATEPLPVEPGDYAAANVHPYAVTMFARMRFEYLDIDQTIIATETPSGYFSAPSAPVSYGPHEIPASTAYLRLRIDLYANTSGGAPAGGDHMTFREATVATAATSAELGTSRANMLDNPSFETYLTSWAGTGEISGVNDPAGPVHGGSSMRLSNAAPPSTVDNYVVNPSFETSAFGYLGSTGVGLSIVSFEHRVGSNSLRHVLSINDLPGGGGTVNGKWEWTTRQYDWTIPCTPGQRLYVRGSLQVTNTAQNWDHPYLAIGLMFNVGATPLQTFYLADWRQDVTRGIWHDLAGGVNVPAGATAARIAVRFAEYPNALHGGNMHAYADALQVTAVDLGGAYFDGSSPDTPVVTYDWLGAPYESQSRRSTYRDTADAGLYQHMTAIGGRYYTASVYAKANTPVPLNLRLLFRNSAGAVLAAPDVVVAPALGGGFARYTFTYAAPAGTTDLQLWLRVTSLAPTAVFWLDAAQVEIGTEATAFLVGSESDADLSFVEPKIWVNVLGQTHDIQVTRRAFDVGTLQAEIIDPDLDPALVLSPLLRPGHAVRLMAPDESATDWSPVFTGTTSVVVVDYEPADFDERKRVHITLNAVDNMQRLANQIRTETVSAIGELAATLEGCGVPWKVNGSGDQIASYTVAAANESASALDQVGIVRDSWSGYAWVDRFNVFNAWDAAVLGSTPKGDLLDELVYASVQPGYDSEVLINEVHIKFLRLKAATATEPASSEEIAFGPYRDEASIRTWGVRKADFTITGMAEDGPTIAAFASSVLAGNGTPAVTLNNMRLHVDVTQDWTAVKDSSWYAWVDLYDLVTVTCERALIVDVDLRVTEIKHTITAPDNKWMLDLAFSGDARVAVPTRAPAIPLRGVTGDPGLMGPMGPQGIQGVQGEQGEPGKPADTISQGVWVWLAPATTADTIGATRIAVNHDSPTLATELLIHKDAKTFDVDFSLYVSALQPGDQIYLQSKATATSWHVYDVTGPPVIKGTTSGPLTTWHVPVQTAAGSPSGTEPANGTDVLVVFSIANLALDGGTSL